MADQIPTPTYKEQEGQTTKLWRKVEEAPYVPIGWAGLIAACTYAALKYKNRGQTSTSLYLLKLRVAAQSMVIGSIMIGVGFSLGKDYYKKYHTDHEPKST